MENISRTYQPFIRTIQKYFIHPRNINKGGLMQQLSKTQTIKQFSQAGSKVNSTKTEKMRNLINRSVLEKPFTQEQIKQREGNFGKMLAYVEGHAVIQRLNDAFDSFWSFTVQKYDIIKETDEVLAMGQLEAAGIVKCQFGSSRITRNRQNGEMVSLADDYKAAATDALKKCSTMLGVGLHLYNGNTPAAENHNSNSSSNGQSHGRPNGNDEVGFNEHGGNGNRLSSKQYRYIMQLNDKTGSNKSDLDERCIEMFGTAAQYLSKNDASAVIEHLLAS